MDQNTQHKSRLKISPSIWRLIAMLVLFVFISDTFVLPNLNQDQNTVLIDFSGEESDSEEENKEAEKDAETKFLYVIDFMLEPVFVSSVYLKIWNNSSLLYHSWDLITPPPEVV